MEDINQITCKHDGAWRSSDLSKPCPDCGSKQYPLIGYRYPYEAKQFFTMLLVFAGILFLAILAGAVFLIYTRLTLM